MDGHLYLRALLDVLRRVDRRPLLVEVEALAVAVRRLDRQRLPGREAGHRTGKDLMVRNASRDVIDGGFEVASGFPACFTSRVGGLARLPNRLVASVAGILTVTRHDGQ